MVGSATYQLSAAVTITLHLGTAGHTGYTDIALLTDSIASLTLISRIAAKAAQNCVKVRKCYELVEELLQPDSKRFVKNNSSSPNSKISVKLDNCGFSWGAEKFSISSTSLTVNAGELVMIVGRIGSGKSSFVSALCGEMQITGGSGKVNGSIGYVEQKPTILNDTLRENVLMGQDFDEAFFWQVMEACDLTQDLQAMSDGDLTKVGSFGLKLSGGQKMRLALA
ncbi:Protein cft-1, partial [Coemansia sp. RSA 1804]